MSQGTLGNYGILGVYTPARKRENSRRWSWSRGIYRSCVSSRPILWVFLARVWKVKGKEERRERGRRRREAKEASYVCGGSLLANYASRKCQGSEHARMNIIQLVIRERTSLGWPHEPCEPYGPPYGLMGRVSYARRPSVPILCPIRLIPSKVPRLGSGHLCGENLSPNFT